MVSEKVKRILLAKSDMSDEAIESLSEMEAWGIVYRLQGPAKPKRRTICLTGFSVSDRERLVRLLEAQGHKIASSVTGRTRLLCRGDNAGPAKIAKALELGVPIMTYEEIIAAIERGEMPE